MTLDAESVPQSRPDADTNGSRSRGGRRGGRGGRGGRGRGRGRGRGAMTQEVNVNALHPHSPILMDDVCLFSSLRLCSRNRRHPFPGMLSGLDDRGRDPISATPCHDPRGVTDQAGNGGMRIAIGTRRVPL